MWEMLTGARQVFCRQGHACDDPLLRTALVMLDWVDRQGRLTAIHAPGNQRWHFSETLASMGRHWGNIAFVWGPNVYFPAELSLVYRLDRELYNSAWTVWIR